jgi:hypothetical protein
MYVYYGFNFSGTGSEILTIGNRVRIHGNLQLWEAGGTYQVTDIQYKEIRPNDPKNIQKIGEGFEASYLLTDANTFANGTVKVETTNEDGEDVIVERSYAELSMNTSLSMQNLVVNRIYTTTNPDTSSVGAMTLTCKVGNTTIVVRTDVLRDADGKLITAEAYENKTIDIKGFVDYYDGEYQIKVLSAKDIIVH